MKLVILGATGNVGSATVQAALSAGHTVVAYVRHPEAVSPRAGLTVVGGSVLDVPAMTSAFAGATAVISAVGSTTPDFAQTTLPPITTAVEKAGVSRFVLVSAFGAGDTKDKASGFARLIYNTVVKKLFTDKALAEAAVLPGLDLDWTVVYPVNLKRGPRAEAAIEPLDRVAKVPGLPTLPFANVGEALVQIAGDASLAKQRVLVTTAKGWRGAR